LPAFDVRIVIAVMGIIAGVGILYKRQQIAKVAREKEAAEQAQIAAVVAKQNSIHQETKRIAQAQVDQERNKILAKHRQNEQILTELGLTIWSIPLEGSENAVQKLEKSHLLAPNKTKPTFNSETRQMVETVKSMIKQSLEKNGEIALPNVLILGKSGSGMNMLINEFIQLAAEKGAGYIVIPSEMFEDHLISGSHVMAFQQLLKVAKTSKSPVYFVLEDGEYLFKQRPKDQKNIVEARRIELVNAFLDLTGEDKRKVSILMKTSKSKNVIDEAFNTRITPIVLQLPGLEERRKIIRESIAQILNDEKDNQFFNLSRIEQMAIKTENFTCANLNTLTETICDISLKKQMDQGIIDSAIELMKNKFNLAN
jgi:hypothetical protein